MPQWRLTMLLWLGSLELTLGIQGGRRCRPRGLPRKELNEQATTTKLIPSVKRWPAPTAMT